MAMKRFILQTNENGKFSIRLMLKVYLENWS